MKMISLTIDGKTERVAEGTIAAAAVLMSKSAYFRKSVSGRPRTPLCGMGICYECRLTIDGIRQEKSCQILAAEGVNIKTDEAN